MAKSQVRYGNPANYNAIPSTRTDGDASALEVTATGSLLVQPEGNVASGATDSGNPVKVGGVYNSTAPTLDNGDRGDLQLDVNGNVKETLATALSKLIDSMTSRPEGCNYINLSASGIVSNVPCILVGMYVNSTSGGTIKLWDNASAGSGGVIHNTITPVIGSHTFFNELTTAGLYCTIATAAIDVTFAVIPQ